MCLIRVADDKNGEGAKPNKIRVNRNSINSFSSKLLKSTSVIFLNYKNLTTSRSSGCKLTCREAFSRSPTTAILFTQKRKRAPNIDDVRDRLAYKQSLSEGKPSTFALALNTILNLVVALSCCITGLCGK